MLANVGTPATDYNKLFKNNFVLLKEFLPFVHTAFMVNSHRAHGWLVSLKISQVWF